MSPLIRSGDRIVVDETKQARADLRDGDVIAIRRDDAIVLKRIMALPGETISGDNRKVFRNGKLVDETYLASPTDDNADSISFDSRTVPQDELFVLGDNRDHSLDSRNEQFKSVKLSDVVGKYSLTYWHAARPAH